MMAEAMYVGTLDLYGSSSKNLTNRSWTSQDSDHSKTGIFVALILSILPLTAVSGNILVVLAVLLRKNLHTPTGYIIFSLAISDLIVGTFVMPMGIVMEWTNGRWPFGTAVCDLFHSFDVLASTASIWNLCIIAVDRYIAVSDPLNYPQKVTLNKTLIVIGILWIASCLISFPAIAWWHRVSPEGQQLNNEDCKFTDDFAYLTFSSLVSFYVPLSIILLAYWRVYRVASKFQNRLKGSSFSARSSLSGGMRVHRGGTATSSLRSKQSVWDADQMTLTTSNLNGRRLNWIAPQTPPSGVKTALFVQQNYEDKQSISKQSTVSNVRSEANLQRSYYALRCVCRSQECASCSSPILQEWTIPRKSAMMRQAKWRDQHNRSCDRGSSGTFRSDIVLGIKGCSTVTVPTNFSLKSVRERNDSSSYVKRNNRAFYRDQRTNSPISNSMDSGDIIVHTAGSPLSMRCNLMNLNRSCKQRLIVNPKSHNQAMIRLCRFQWRVVSQESKAAKTLGIVVTCFIVCWLPFFIINILSGFCQICTEDEKIWPITLITVNWLGYCNSALNPFIYSFFSREFRNAFLFILQRRCFRSRKRAETPTCLKR